MRTPTPPLALVALAALAACEEPKTYATYSADTGATTDSAPRTCAEVDREAEGAELPFDAEATLSGVYRVDGRQIYDAGQVLTVEPGTVFLMGPDSSLLFGWRSDPATVYMQGTPEAPILFCGTAPGAGHWAGVELLTGTTTDSFLEHVRVEDAGLDERAAVLMQVELDLVGVEIVGNAAVGLDADLLGAGSADLTLSENAVPAHLHSGAAITALPAGDYTGNLDDVVLISGQEDEDVVFHDRGVPYRQLDDRVVYGSADGRERSITFEAGVTYQFCTDCFLVVGWRSDPATITASGTADAPVRFTAASASPQPGSWNGVHLLSGSRSSSLLEHVHFSYGGKAGGDAANGANLTVDGGLGTLRDCQFANSAGYGMWLESVEPGFSESGSVFVDNAAGDVYDARDE